MSLMEDNQYLVAWFVYILGGVGFCLFWWRMTDGMKNRGIKDLLRGFTLVIIFTPWFAADQANVWAPAVLVLLMDLLLEGAAAGMQSGFALLLASFFMLLYLTFRQYRRMKQRKV